MYAAPEVSGERVFLGSCAGSFYALDLASGEVLWRFDTGAGGQRPAQFHGRPLLAEGKVVVGSDGSPVAHLLAFDAGSGDLLWQVPFRHGVAVDVLRDGDRTLVVGMDGEAAATSLDGAPVWHRDDGPPARQGGRSQDPASDGERLFIPWRTATGRVDALAVDDGRRLWGVELGAVPTTSATVAGDVVLIGALDGRLHRLRPGSGEALEAWSLGGIPYGDLTRQDGRLLVLLAGGEPAGGGFSGPHDVVAIDVASGEIAWRHEGGAEEWSTPTPLVRDGVVVVGHRGEVRGLDVAGGERLWRLEVEGTPRGLAAGGGTLVVGTLEGKVMGYDWPRRPEGAGPAEPAAAEEEAETEEPGRKP